MKNKEFYLDEILDLISNGCSVAIKNGVPTICGCTCEGCCCFDKLDATGSWECKKENIKKWANEEHVEYEVDWEQVPVDTPIYVWNDEDEGKTKAHFAQAEEDDFILYIYAWDGGKTSFTCGNSRVKMTEWDHIELAEPHPEWMKKKGSR